MMQIDDDPLQQRRQDVDDDDNAAIESDASDAEDNEQENNPLVLTLDDLESRIVTALNEFKSHPGRATNPAEMNVHDELSSVLRTVVEVSAHSGPASARMLASNYPGLLTVEECVDEIYDRINSALVLPVILESAQSDMVPAKRAASLACFHAFHVEWQRGGSYLDTTGGVLSLAGPYGAGATVSSSSSSFSAPQLSALEISRRNQMRAARRSELLRRWVQASLPNLAPGTFSSASSDAAAASRGVLSASASLKPCLRYMADRIGNADDAGALRLFLPVMRMISGVLGRLFLERSRNGGKELDWAAGDALRASCIKFLEIVVLCFSNRALPGAAEGSAAALRMQKKETPRGGASATSDFALEDLPPGHPVITREGLEEIGEYCFSTLRGLVLLGGQVCIDSDQLAAALQTSVGSDYMGGSSPFTQVLDILKPAALAFLQVESAAEKTSINESFVLNRSSIEFDFGLSQKSYSLSINAIQMLATKRPIFFKDSSTCLARRTMDPPGGIAGDADGLLSKAAVIGIRTHLRSTCLTLLRNFLSVTSGCGDILVAALTCSGMQAQAERALQSSRQQVDLMMGGRAARNRAAIFYEWDTSADDTRAKKRQRDTDDAEARARAVKIARGLGSGIQLPSSMVDACELVILNLSNLPPKRPPGKVERKHPIDLDFVVDAVITNGTSLSIDENHWYDRDGGDAWIIDEGEVGEDGRKSFTFTLNNNVLKAAEKMTRGSEMNDSEKAFVEQSKLAASNAFSRVMLSASNARSNAVADLGRKLAARLAWTLKEVNPTDEVENAHAMAVEATETRLKKDIESKESLAGSLEFALEYPLVASCLAFDLVPKGTSNARDDIGSSASAPVSSLSMRILSEAYVCSLSEDKENYEKCLDLFVLSVVNACDLSNKTPNDSEMKRIANTAASLLPQQLAAAPSLSRTSLEMLGSLCDIDEISRKAATKSSKQTIAESAALHAAKTAAEKRATAALLILRDVAFQRPSMRGPAVDCAVAIASGRLPASPSIEDKALKLVMNVLFPKNSDCEDKVVLSASKELEFAANYSIDNYTKIQLANESNAKKKEKQRHGSLKPQSDEEKIVLDRVRKPVVLVMALCVRRPEIIKAIMEMGCRDRADVLAKAIKFNMPKLTKAATVKHGECYVKLFSFMFAATPLSTKFISRGGQYCSYGLRHG